MTQKGYAVVTGSRDEVIPLHSIYEQSPITIASQLPRHQLGDKARLSDGRVFHYASNGTAGALVAGHLLQNAVTVAGHWNMACTVAALGTRRIPFTPGTTNITQNQYANGYAWINAGVGAGMYYKIKSHLAIALSVAGYLELYDPLVVALDATSKVTITPNPWKGLIEFPTTLTGIPMGVAPIAVTQSTATITYYFWAQTWGPCCILAGGTQVITTPDVHPGTRAGGVIVEATTGVPTMAWLLNGLQVTDNEFAGCFLRISQ